MNGLDFFEILSRAIYKEDEDIIAGLLGHDFVLHQDDGLPYGGAYHGAKGFKEIRRLVFNIWQHRAVERVSVIGNEIDQSFSIVLKMSGRLDETEQVTCIYVSEVWNVQDGKAKWARVWYSNTPEVAERCKARYAELINA